MSKREAMMRALLDAEDWLTQKDILDNAKLTTKPRTTEGESNYTNLKSLLKRNIDINEKKEIYGKDVYKLKSDFPSFIKLAKKRLIGDDDRTHFMQSKYLQNCLHSKVLQFHIILNRLIDIVGLEGKPLKLLILILEELKEKEKEYKFENHAQIFKVIKEKIKTMEVAESEKKKIITLFNELDHEIDFENAPEELFRFYIEILLLTPSGLKFALFSHSCIRDGIPIIPTPLIPKITLRGIKLEEYRGYFYFSLLLSVLCYSLIYDLLTLPKFYDVARKEKAKSLLDSIEEMERPKIPSYSEDEAEKTLKKIKSLENTERHDHS